MERQFHENMKDKGVLGGRTLEVEADYKREFIKVETAAGEKLDDLIEKWRDYEVGEGDTTTRPYSELADTLHKAFDYTNKIKLVEAIKAEEAAERALDHLKMGRKVVIFALPGAFSRTCDASHMPSFIRTKDGFAEKGVDEIMCLAVNDPFVMG